MKTILRQYLSATYVDWWMEGEDIRSTQTVISTGHIYPSKDKEEFFSFTEILNYIKNRDEIANIILVEK